MEALKMLSQKLTLDHSIFFTPEKIAREQKEKIEPARGKLLIASCRSGAYLAEKVVKEYKQLLSQNNSKG